MCLCLIRRTVLPSAAERLLSHWKTLDEAAGEGQTFSQTMRGLLRVTVASDESAAGVGDKGGTSTRSHQDADLCQWLLSQSLSSQEAVSRPSFTTRITARATGKSGVRDSGQTRDLSHHHQPPDDELTGRVIRAYRSFATVGLFRIVGVGRLDGGRGGEALPLAAGIYSTVLRLPEGLRPASEMRAATALRLAIELGLPTTTSTTSTTSTGISRVSFFWGFRQATSRLIEAAQLSTTHRRSVRSEPMVFCGVNLYCAR